MAAMSKVEPTWTDVEASQALHTCFVLENPDTYSELPVDPSIVSELVVPSEAKAIHEYASGLEKIKAKKTIKAHVRDGLMKHYFKLAPASHKKPASSQKKAPRWWASANDDILKASAFIEKHLPSSVRLYTDPDNGRWRVISDSHGNTSVSWTARGVGDAAAQCIHVGWMFHKDAHPGEQPPFDLNELAQQFADE